MKYLKLVKNKISVFLLQSLEPCYFVIYLIKSVVRSDMAVEKKIQK